MHHHTTLEFDKIKQLLADQALSDQGKACCLALAPSVNEAEVKRCLDETTQAKRMLQQTGTPPLPSMTQLQKAIVLIEIDALLMPEQIVQVATFLVACRRMKAYLKKAEAADAPIAWYGEGINALPGLEHEIARCIRNNAVDDQASEQLAAIRRRMEGTVAAVKTKLAALLRKNKAWFSESFVSLRNGRYTLPVKREHKNDVAGTIVDLSQTGATCFIEPAAVGRLQSELAALQMEEDNEVRRILYSLTAHIADNLAIIRVNIETMEKLDFLFAKGKLSLTMNAAPVSINAGREIRLIKARHPLLPPAAAIPLDFAIGAQTTGVIITGPNTGGKTVALKTIGLLSLMAQSGLHVPADEDSSLCLHNLILCDIGDKQSIKENLSTFSSHMKNIIEILEQANHESLVLLDELGSGTDPAEGMGLAVAILDELSAQKCLFVVTTHYSEIKAYAANKPGLVNARMAFDKESLLPLYRLEIGKAGDSCALYIAERLGMQPHLILRAHAAAYGVAQGVAKPAQPPQRAPDQKNGRPVPRIEREKPPAPTSCRGKFAVGDSVMVYPHKEIGIVYAGANARGEVGVQLRDSKKIINHKRLKLQVAASELYPDNYDFSIVFDSVTNRKARKLMEKRHVKDTVLIVKEGDEQN
ncbi:endonuclease MutS2 [Sporomusa termitida]|uniref:Endonuclease MutS2 n=1 Tax=Sporomusa termitida TaxID=2377 RepID=A0A517DWB4_9FIRM|nr:DNA mismatch repair protein MutS [Sporomusa termitida]QDR81556.1 Endonuclease MutS2 [Sporomusa termitida]